MICYTKNEQTTKRNENDFSIIPANWMRRCVWQWKSKLRRHIKPHQVARRIFLLCESNSIAMRVTQSQTHATEYGMVEVAEKKLQSVHCPQCVQNKTNIMLPFESNFMFRSDHYSNRDNVTFYLQINNWFIMEWIVLWWAHRPFVI